MLEPIGRPPERPSFAQPPETKPFTSANTPFVRTTEPDSIHGGRIDRMAGPRRSMTPAAIGAAAFGAANEHVTPSANSEGPEGNDKKEPVGGPGDPPAFSVRLPELTGETSDGPADGQESQQPSFLNRVQPGDAPVTEQIDDAHKPAKEPGHVSAPGDDLSGTPEEYTHFGYSRNGLRVVYDPVGSHASTHFADTPNLRSLVEEVIAQTEVSGDSMGFHTDMSETVGHSDLVETDETDEIVYARRPNRDTYMRFTQSRPPRPSSLVTVILTRQSEDTYSLFSAWIGPITPAFPGTPREEEASKPFWETHALAGEIKR